MLDEDFYMYKSVCEDKDWGNKREITLEELAWCILEHDLDLNKVPTHRRDAVAKLIAKLQKQRDKQNKYELERKLIELELAQYEHIDDGTLLGTHTDKIVGYYFDPDLFKTSFEASVAMSELESCVNHEMMKTEDYGHKYKNTNIYNRDVARLKQAMSKVRDQYVKLGGSKAEFNKHISQIPLPNKGTLKQDIDAQRERIINEYRSMGVSLRRSKDIAIAITTEAYYILK